jgi:hypothetical protein
MKAILMFLFSFIIMSIAAKIRYAEPRYKDPEKSLG